jgi:hypothetical protein
VSVLGLDTPPRSSAATRPSMAVLGGYSTIENTGVSLGLGVQLRIGSSALVAVAAVAAVAAAVTVALVIVAVALVVTFDVVPRAAIAVTVG